MNIILTADYRLLSNDRNYILMKRYTNDPTHHFSKGELKETWKPAGYFSKLIHVYRYLTEILIQESDVQTLEELKQVVNQLQQLKEEMM